MCIRFHSSYNSSYETMKLYDYNPAQLKLLN